MIEKDFKEISYGKLVVYFDYMINDSEFFSHFENSHKYIECDI